MCMHGSKLILVYCVVNYSAAIEIICLSLVEKTRECGSMLERRMGVHNPTFTGFLSEASRETKIGIIPLPLH